MSEGRTLLLLEESESVIKDVVCSMRLIGIPVQVARSVAEAHSLATSVRPALILARARLKASPQAANELHSRLVKDPEASLLPIVVIGTPSELAMHGAEGFLGEIPVPVEFPTFANEVQKKLVSISGRIERGGPAPIDKDTEPLAIVKPAEAAPEITASPPVLDASISLEKKLVAVYAIQMAVLDELKGSAVLLDAAPAEIAGRVAEVTAKVCKTFNVAKRIL